MVQGKRPVVITFRLIQFHRGRERLQFDSVSIQLPQSVINFCLNSVHAMGQTLTQHRVEMEPTEQLLQEASTLHPGHYAATEEADDGPRRDPSPPPEHSGEADGDKPPAPSCKAFASGSGPRRALPPQAHVVCVPVLLRHCSDASPSARTRVYQVWPGKNVFFLRGRIICGPDPRGFLLTAVSILLSTWIFCFYVGSDSPEASSLTVTFALILALIVMVSLVMVATTDPGIIPRNIPPPTPEEEADTSRRRRSRRISIEGVETKQKYCRVCRAFRPPRSCHCAVCDNCVEKFDHHCPWVGQCVGLRNYRFFVMFISSALVFFAYVLAFAWRRVGRVVARAGAGVLIALRVAPETVALGLFSAVAVWFLGGLVVFHYYLISVNQTARENFKQRYKTSPNPYDKGILKNIKEALLLSLPSSNVDFRAEIDPCCSSGAGILQKADGEEVTRRSHGDDKDSGGALHGRGYCETVET